MLRACPRCQGDLLFDSVEEDFACLQCGRHASVSVVIATQQVAKAEAPAPVPALAA